MEDFEHRAMSVKSQLEFPDLVRETRGRLGLTQTQLARIARSLVSKREPLGKWAKYALYQWH